MMNPLEFYQNYLTGRQRLRPLQILKNSRKSDARESILSHFKKRDI